MSTLTYVWPREGKNSCSAAAGYLASGHPIVSAVLAVWVGNFSIPYLQHSGAFDTSSGA